MDKGCARVNYKTLPEQNLEKRAQNGGFMEEIFLSYTTIPPLELNYQI